MMIFLHKLGYNLRHIRRYTTSSLPASGQLEIKGSSIASPPASNVDLNIGESLGWVRDSDLVSSKGINNGRVAVRTDGDWAIFGRQNETQSASRPIPEYDGYGIVFFIEYGGYERVILQCTQSMFAIFALAPEGMKIDAREDGIRQGSGQVLMLDVCSKKIDGGRRLRRYTDR